MNQEILKEIIEQDYTKIQQGIETFLKNSVSQNKADGVVFGLSGDIVESGITNANAFFPNNFADKYATVTESIPPLRPKTTPPDFFSETACFRNPSIVRCISGKYVSSSNS